MTSRPQRQSSSPLMSVSDKDAAEEPRLKKRRTTNGSFASRISSRRSRKTACQPCRLRKIKCDSSRPVCALCRASGADCEYLDPPDEKLTLELATQKLLSRLDQLQNEVQNVESLLLDQSQPFHPLGTHDVHRNGAPLASQPFFADSSATESSRDFLQIPSRETSSDTILRWGIFENKYPSNALIGVLFTDDQYGSNDNSFFPPCSPRDTFTVSGGLRQAEEERIPMLVDNFLENVHTKNPILDVEGLVKHGRKYADTGVGWDAWSCLVLLACALGSCAKPFDTAAPAPPIVRPESAIIAAAPPPSSAIIFSKELQLAESYFVLACRRLGLLKHTMLAAQCHFFAGGKCGILSAYLHILTVPVYLMYTLRPILSWQYFYHASIVYQLYLKTTHGIFGSASDILEVPTEHLSGMSRKQRRLEQSLYWSCFKSECEFRVELPLPQSDIATCDYPNLFPSPPSPAVLEPIDGGAEQPTPDSMHHLRHPNSDMHLNNLTRFDTTSTIDSEELELRQHAKRLCNEEESWYYYLTEVALRRIGNRIINTFFRQDHRSWLDIKPLLSIALEFDAQVSSWSANLPPAMQHYETTMTIRAPIIGIAAENSTNYVSRELSWATDNRLLEMRSWLYQPFLYYLIHSGQNLVHPPHDPDYIHARAVHASNINSVLNHPSPPINFKTAITASAPLTADDMAVLQRMIVSGIECNLKIIDVRSLRHRHHGLWYDLRSTMGAALILLAIVKSGHSLWIPGGLEALWGTYANDGTGESHIGGKIGKVLAQFDFWSQESPDLMRHHQVLEEVVSDVRRRVHG